MSKRQRVPQVPEMQLFLVERATDRWLQCSELGLPRIDLLITSLLQILPGNTDIPPLSPPSVVLASYPGAQEARMKTLSTYGYL